MTDATEHAAQVRIDLVGRAWNRELATLIAEWCRSNALPITVGQQSTLKLEHVLVAERGSSSMRVWLTVVSPRLARLYFADPARERFLVRKIPLANGMDELGREKIAQVLLSSAQAFLERRVSSSVQSVREAIEREPIPDPSTSATQASELPRAAHEQDRRGPADGTPALAPGDDGERTHWKWGLGAQYLATYRGQEGLGHGLGAELEGLIKRRAWHFGLRLEAHLEPPHRVEASRPAVELELLIGSARAGPCLAWTNQRGHGWLTVVAGGLDWVRFEPSSPADSNLSATERGDDYRPVVYWAVDRTWQFGALRLSLGGHAVVQLVDTHYDQVESAERKRILEPWPVQPGLHLAGVLHFLPPD